MYCTIPNYDFDYDRINHLLEEKGTNQIQLTKKTSIVKDENIIHIFLYHKSIMLFYPDRIEIHASPYYSNTTYETLNAYLPRQFYLVRKNSLWYLKRKRLYMDFPFQDGICIKTKERRIENYMDREEEQFYLDNVVNIKSYVDYFVDFLMNHELSFVTCNGLPPCNYKSIRQITIYEEEEYKEQQKERFIHVQEHMRKKEIVIDILEESLKHGRKIAPIGFKILNMIKGGEEFDQCLFNQQRENVEGMFKRAMTRYLLHIGGLHVVP